MQQTQDRTPVPSTAGTDPLMYADGSPTKRGWRVIGEELRKPMPSKQRKGSGGRTWDYITARQVQARLDAVIGPGNWSTRFRLLDPAALAVECNLSVFGVTKADVGLPNNPEHPEEEAIKSAYSDAFKRAAVHFGIGRFLYGEV